MKQIGLLISFFLNSVLFVVGICRKFLLYMFLTITLVTRGKGSVLYSIWYLWVSPFVILVKSCTMRGFDPRTVQPVVSRYTD
jgi:hypothetical protein